MSETQGFADSILSSLGISSKSGENGQRSDSPAANARQATHASLSVMANSDALNIHVAQASFSSISSIGTLASSDAATPTSHSYLSARSQQRPTLEFSMWSSSGYSPQTAVMSVPATATPQSATIQSTQSLRTSEIATHMTLIADANGVMGTPAVAAGAHAHATSENAQLRLSHSGRMQADSINLANSSSSSLDNPAYRSSIVSPGSFNTSTPTNANTSSPQVSNMLSPRQQSRLSRKPVGPLEPATGKSGSTPSNSGMRGSAPLLSLPTSPHIQNLSTIPSPQQGSSPTMSFFGMEPSRKTSKQSTNTGMNDTDGHGTAPSPTVTELRMSTHSNTNGANSSMGSSTPVVSSTSNPVPPNPAMRTNSSNSVASSNHGAPGDRRISSNLKDIHAAIDFEKMLTSTETKKLSSTPERMRHIEVKKTNEMRLEAKGAVIEKEISITSLMRSNKFQAESAGSASVTGSKTDLAQSATKDDDIDELINGPGKNAKAHKRETFWEFLKSTGPEDVLGPKSLGQNPAVATSQPTLSLPSALAPSAQASFKEPASTSPATASTPTGLPGSTMSPKVSSVRKYVPAHAESPSLQMASGADDDLDDQDAQLFGITTKSKEQINLAEFLNSNEPPQNMSSSSKFATSSQRDISKRNDRSKSSASQTNSPVTPRSGRATSASSGSTSGHFRLFGRGGSVTNIFMSSNSSGQSDSTSSPSTQTRIDAQQSGQEASPSTTRRPSNFTTFGVLSSSSRRANAPVSVMSSVPELTTAATKQQPTQEKQQQPIQETRKASIASITPTLPSSYHSTKRPSLAEVVQDLGALDSEFRAILGRISEAHAQSTEGSDELVKTQSNTVTAEPKPALQTNTVHHDKAVEANQKVSVSHIATQVPAVTALSHRTIQTDAIRNTNRSIQTDTDEATPVITDLEAVSVATSPHIPIHELVWAMSQQQKLDEQVDRSCQVDLAAPPDTVDAGFGPDTHRIEGANISTQTSPVSVPQHDGGKSVTDKMVSTILPVVHDAATSPQDTNFPQDERVSIYAEYLATQAIASSLTSLKEENDDPVDKFAMSKSTQTDTTTLQPKYTDPDLQNHPAFQALIAETTRLRQNLNAMQLAVETERVRGDQLEILKESAEARFEQLARVTHRKLMEVMDRQQTWMQQQAGHGKSANYMEPESAPIFASSMAAPPAQPGSVRDVSISPDSTATTSTSM